MLFEQIKQVLIQIMDDESIGKPDIFCSEIIFMRLKERVDCEVHPIRQDTLVMYPNVYWTISYTIDNSDILPNTKKGYLVLKYLELVAHYANVENGDMSIIEDFILEEKKRREES